MATKSDHNQTTPDYDDHSNQHPTLAMRRCQQTTYLNRLEEVTVEMITISSNLLLYLSKAICNVTL